MTTRNWYNSGSDRQGGYGALQGKG